MHKEHLNGFCSYVQVELGLSVRTLAAYKFDVQEFLNFMSETDETKFSAMCLERFVTFLGRKILSDRTVCRKYMSVRSFYNYLIATGQLPPNILQCVDSVKYKTVVGDTIGQEEIRLLLSTIGGKNALRNKAIVLLLYQSGLRVSELCNLNIRDITTNLLEARVAGKGECDRIVPITRFTASALKDYLSTRKDGAVFVQQNGSRMTRRGVSDMLLSLSRRAGIKTVTAHTLRRSFASQLMDNGADLEIVQRLLGHKYLTTTAEYLPISRQRLFDTHKKYHPSFNKEFAFGKR